MPETTAPLLTESEVSEIEARANAASQPYVVDWSKGEHALLQASGWRPANEEQPRTIATFDKEDGYLDLLFCAEARADIPALIRDRRALKAALDDLQVRFGAACEHVKIVEGECRTKDETIVALREQLAENARNHFDDARDLETRLAQAIRERDEARRQRRELSGDMLGGL